MLFDMAVKVGGSLCSSPELRRYAAGWAAAAGRSRLLFVAGGGIIADQIRMLDACLHLSDSAAHWMAILAMDQSAYLLADCMPKAALVDSLEAAAQAVASGQVAILAPSSLLQQTDPLPHTWQVTSDSLAAWLAGYAGAERLTLLKDVAGVYEDHPPHEPAHPLPEIARSDLAGCGVVDAYFVEALPDGVDCWIIDGRQPERLVELVEQRRTIGTRIR